MNASIGTTDDLLADFVEESLEALHELPGHLHAFSQDSQNAPAINTVFRTIHTIKGNAGFFGLQAIKEFSHALENTLDELRSGKLALQEDLERAIVDGFDVVEETIQRLVTEPPPVKLGDRERAILDRIAESTVKCRTDHPSQFPPLDVLEKIAAEIESADLPQSKDWSSRLLGILDCELVEAAPEEPPSLPENGLPGPKELLASRFEVQGHDISEYVGRLCELFHSVKCEGYTDAQGFALEEAFQQLIEWCVGHEATDLANLLKTTLEDFHTLRDSPLELDAALLWIVWDKLAPAFIELQAGSSQKETSSPSAQTETPPRADPPQGASGKGRLLRVREEKLDAFVEDVASLFITCEQLKSFYSRMAATNGSNRLVEELRRINTTLSSQAKDLQQSVVALRKVPIRGLFTKFPRLARTLASNLGKKINVHLEGEEVEVDKSLIDDLDGPLTHMVRNVADHAIEAPEERLLRGVTEAGNLWLKAEQHRSTVIVTVQDDGRGIDGGKLRQKAVEKGVLSESAAASLSQQEAIELIFHPGFSTAEQISEVSGRGVGMDVVRSNLREYNAKIHIESQVGVGTTFRLEIPTRETVVVVDGLVVEHRGQKFVIPLNDLSEICEISRDEFHFVQGTRVLTVRGKPCAAIPLDLLLGIPSSDDEDSDDACFGIVTLFKGGCMCLVVDKVVGQHKVVISGIRSLLPDAKNFAGVSMLGEDELALVLNMEELSLAAASGNFVLPADC